MKIFCNNEMIGSGGLVYEAHFVPANEHEHRILEALIHGVMKFSINPVTQPNPDNIVLRFTFNPEAPEPSAEDLDAVARDIQAAAETSGEQPN